MSRQSSAQQARPSPQTNFIFIFDCSHMSITCVKCKQWSGSKRTNNHFSRTRLATLYQQHTFEIFTDCCIFRARLLALLVDAVFYWLLEFEDEKSYSTTFYVVVVFGLCLVWFLWFDKNSIACR